MDDDIIRAERKEDNFDPFTIDREVVSFPVVTLNVLHDGTFHGVTHTKASFAETILKQNLNLLLLFYTE